MFCYLSNNIAGDGGTHTHRYTSIIHLLHSHRIENTSIISDKDPKTAAASVRATSILCTCILVKGDFDGVLFLSGNNSLERLVEAMMQYKGRDVNGPRTVQFFLLGVQ